MGIAQKNVALEQLLTNLNLKRDQVAVMGDDWPDIACLKEVGLATCPADAVAEVQTVCDWTASLPGGQGAVRELINHLCQAQGLLPQFV
jgi:3-deoxy-D-manno-octulosonate 8-phosphate phosphatase (KDO 8-P phosphatase)